jgi:hypothetical protein
MKLMVIPVGRSLFLKFNCRKHCAQSLSDLLGVSHGPPPRMIDFSLEDRAQRRQAQQVLQEVTAAPRQIELSSNCLIRLPHRLSLMRSRGMVRRAFPFLKVEKNRNSRSADGRERRARRRLARMAVAKAAGLFC